jgi:hypothetical protein
VRNPFLENSRARYESLARRLVEQPGGGRLDDIRELLVSKDFVEHPICGSKGENEFYSSLGLFTFASTIMVLSNEPALHVALGPPDVTPFPECTFHS